MTTRQPLVISRSHVTIWPPTQALPAPAVQFGGGGPHEQFAEGAAPVHGFPVGQAMVAPAARHPAVSGAHATTVWFVAQLVPAWPPQIAGAVGHVHAAFGKLPIQGLVAAQVSKVIS